MERELDLTLLKKNMLFRNLTDGEILEVIDTMSPRVVTYPRRTVVGRDGDEFPEIGVILAGNVHLSHIDSNGNSNLMDVLSAGATLGELNSVGRYRLHVTITATAQTEILYLSVDRLLRKNVLTAPHPDPLSAEPDPGGGQQGPVPDPQAGGQHPPLHPGTAAGLPVGPVSQGRQPYLCDPAQPAGPG